MKGRRVRTLAQLIQLAEAKQCVWVNHRSRHCPAVVLANMPATVVHRFLSRGAVYVYVPKREKAGEWYTKAKKGAKP